VTTRRPLAFTALTVLALLVAGCGSPSSDGDSSTTTTTPPGAGGATTTTPGVKGELTVSDAASLTKAFADIGKGFERANPDTSISFNPDSSATLAAQIEQGAPADVFASADEKNMDRLVQGNKVAGSPQVFARNRLVIITKPGNPEKIRSLADLADAGTVSLCAAGAPCGNYAAQVLRRAKVTIAESSITRSTNATATTQAVSRGDAVAAIVYVTDARTAGRAVDTVTIPDAQNAIASYPVAALAGSKNAALAEAFVAYVTSPEGEAVLKEYGFLPPG
jgi:molybdate transport system substrate-binding protein